jgi:hypothetical protein
MTDTTDRRESPTGARGGGRTGVIDLDALRQAVQAVDVNAKVYRWASPHENVIRICRTNKLGEMSIDVSQYGRARPRLEVSLCKRREDRAVLRAVLDALDRTES